MAAEYPPSQKPYTRNAEIIDPEVYPQGMHRYALGVEYNGRCFHGFQKQPSGVPTVQAALESVLSEIAAEPITLVCAGRTDAGVHASGQVIHFDTLAERPVRAWTRGVNARLSDAVSVHWARAVEPAFHARFSASARTYRYLLYNSQARPALAGDFMTWEDVPLDMARMTEAAAYLQGTHDFSAFRAAQCQAHSPVRTVESILFFQNGSVITMEIKANAFLHHMVRNIMGSLLMIGKGRRPVDWLAELLVEGDRRRAGATAKPDGLHLVAVDYPKHFDLPLADSITAHFC